MGSRRKGETSQNRIPPRWLECPRKSLGLIAGKFLAIKTPLDSRHEVPLANVFTPDMLLKSMESYKANVGLWIDLTNTKRFYDKSLIKPVPYVKVACRGHGETPSKDQVSVFVNVVDHFIKKNPLAIIVVHCTHGFNRSGFMIGSYLTLIENWSPEASLAEFARFRPPGIYKQDYLTDFFERYGDVTDVPTAPELPDWCLEDDNEVDEDGRPIEGEHSSLPSGSTPKPARAGIFMENVPGMIPITEQPLCSEVQRKARRICGFSNNSFPGSQPVSLTESNLSLLKNGYMVSWKADGTRYMMLVDGHDQTYLLDRNNCVYRVPNITFVDKEGNQIQNTLVDGEMVLQEDPNKKEKSPRYLIYDIVQFMGVKSSADFRKRMHSIKEDLMGPRVNFLRRGKIDRRSETFGAQQKFFWDVNYTHVLLGPKFSKEQLGHEPDGLIFQPVHKPYTGGTDRSILKWKPHTHNSVDFLLRVEKDNRPGYISSFVGKLYVRGYKWHYGEIRLVKGLKQYDNKIIECNWDGEWKFMRERTDKSFPNAKSVADNVVGSIHNPITEDTLCQFVKEIPKMLEHH